MNYSDPVRMMLEARLRVMHVRIEDIECHIDLLSHGRKTLVFVHIPTQYGIGFSLATNTQRAMESNMISLCFYWSRYLTDFFLPWLQHRLLWNGRVI